MGLWRCFIFFDVKLFFEILLWLFSHLKVIKMISIFIKNKRTQHYFILRGVGKCQHEVSKCQNKHSLFTVSEPDTHQILIFPIFQSLNILACTCWKGMSIASAVMFRVNCVSSIIIFCNLSIISTAPCCFRTLVLHQKFLHDDFIFPTTTYLLIIMSLYKNVNSLRNEHSFL